VIKRLAMFVTTDCVFTKEPSQESFTHLSPLFTLTVKHTYSSPSQTPSLTEKRAMTRLLFTTLLCALGITQASARNVVSQRLLELDDDERNASFTLMLKDSDRRCDQVIRTLFNGTVLGVDEWEALCKDRNADATSVLDELRRPLSHPWLTENVAAKARRPAAGTSKWASAADGAARRRVASDQAWLSSRSAQRLSLRSLGFINRH
jgi:hypothetical protein